MFFSLIIVSMIIAEGWGTYSWDTLFSCCLGRVSDDGPEWACWQAIPAALQLPQGCDRSQRIWHSSAEISLTNEVDSDYLANFACFTLFIVSVRLNAALQGYSSRCKNYSSIRTNLVAQSLEKRNVVSEENAFSEFTIIKPHQNLV